MQAASEIALLLTPGTVRPESWRAGVCVLPRHVKGDRQAALWRGRGRRRGRGRPVHQRGLLEAALAHAAGGHQPRRRQGHAAHVLRPARLPRRPARSRPPALAPSTRRGSRRKACAPPLAPEGPLAAGARSGAVAQLTSWACAPLEGPCLVRASVAPRGSDRPLRRVAGRGSIPCDTGSNCTPGVAVWCWRARC